MTQETLAKIAFWMVWGSMFLCALFGFVMSQIVGRFKNPDFSETRLLMEYWPYYGMMAGGAFVCTLWSTERPK